MDKYFEQGFIDKCAEYGIDPNTIIKYAQELDQEDPEDAGGVKGLGSQMLTGAGKGLAAGGVLGAGAGLLSSVAALANPKSIKMMRAMGKNPASLILKAVLASTAGGATAGGLGGAATGALLRPITY